MIELEQAAKLYDIYQRAFSMLCEVDVVLSKLPESVGVDAFLGAHHDIMMAIQRDQLGELVEWHPELDTDVPDDTPITQLTPDEQTRVDALTARQVQRTDEALLSDCDWRGRKVARIVATALSLMHGELPKDLPLGFYALRVQALVDAGTLESRGNIGHIRFSEVRLARDPFADLVDGYLAVDRQGLQALTQFRDGPKRTDCIDAEHPGHAGYLSANLDDLADRLLQGIEANPSKRWVMTQFQQSLVPVAHDGFEAQERFGDELEKVMHLLGIDSSDGLLDYYLSW